MLLKNVVKLSIAINLSPYPVAYRSNEAINPSIISVILNFITPNNIVGCNNFHIILIGFIHNDARFVLNHTSLNKTTNGVSKYSTHPIKINTFVIFITLELY